MAAKHNNNKKKNNYFTKAIQRYNDPDFIKYKNAKELEFESNIIFRELASGKIDIVEFGCYFVNPDLLNAMIKVSYEKYIFYYYSHQGMQALAQLKGADATISMVQDAHRRSTEAYRILNEGLQHLAATGDPNQVFALANLLFNYRSCF